MAYCPNCGTDNPETARFCNDCGRQMADVAEARAAMDPPVGLPQIDDGGRVIADDGLPVGEDLDGVPGGERLIWRGRPSRLWSPIRSVTNRYRLTNERLIWVNGFISRKTEEVDLFRVNDVSVKQGLIQRVLNLGDVTVFMNDASTDRKILPNITDPNRVKDLVRAASRIERQRRRVLLREEMGA